MLVENNNYTQDVRVRNEAESLTQAGFRVTVICPARDRSFSHADVDGVRTYNYPRPPDGNGMIGYVMEYSYSLFMMGIITFYVFVRYGFSAIHAHNPPDILVLIALFYKLLGKRFVFDHHDLSPELYYARFYGKGNSKMYNLLKRFEILSCRVADRVIATNESYKAIEMDRAGIAPDKITIVRNGPDMAVTDYPAKDQTPASNQPVIIGYLGVIGHQDGADYLVRAVEHLVSQLGCTQIQCVVAGTGDALDDVKALTHELDIANYFKFTGWINREDIPDMLRSFDICVAPEPSNDFTDHSTMIKILEYMAFSKPIVAFDLPEHHHSAGDAALYATNNDVKELASLIASLIKDPARRKKMGELGRQRIRDNLAWEHQERKLVEMYSNLLSFKLP